MELRPGYKRTEIGVIPEGWDVVPIGDIAKFTSGSPIDVSALHRRSSDYPVPVFGGNGIAGYTDNALVLAPCVVVGRVGQKCGTVYFSDGPAWITDNALYPKHVHRPTDMRFLALALEGARLNEAKNRNDLPLITQAIVHGVRMAWPLDVSEQCTIAEVLGDVDALIAALDRLIAKKRAIKQGAMQQLLTGKARLPGFSGEWVARTVEDAFQFLQTASNSRSDLSKDGDVKYIHYGDIHTKWSTFLDCESDDLPLIQEARLPTVPFLEDGDLVMADASEDYEGIGTSVEVRNATGSKVVAGLHTLLLRGDKGLLADGFKGYVQFIPSFKSALIKIATGISVYGIAKSRVQQISIDLPPLPEQRAIAAVLSDMDAEIAALEARRDKTRALKQGMMQELLTGRMRLV